MKPVRLERGLAGEAALSLSSALVLSQFDCTLFSHASFYLSFICLEICTIPSVCNFALFGVSLLSSCLLLFTGHDTTSPSEA